MADRLDTLLVLLGHYESRARARDAIKRGVIVLNGRTVTKPSALSEHDAEIAIRDPAQDYVSRAALKLIAGLEHFGFDPKNRTAIDIGASTGGFTQVLLEHGCKTVFAVTTGKGVAPRPADHAFGKNQCPPSQHRKERPAGQCFHFSGGERCELHFDQIGFAAFA